MTVQRLISEATVKNAETRWIFRFCSHRLS